ncbi:MAG: hypothetical protein R3F55_00210 [Alphaproteobacteria bacterium]
MVLLSLLSLGGVVAFVDPYGISPLAINMRGINIDRVARQNADMRAFKQIDILRQQPEVVFIGSSKTNQAIDPEFASIVFGLTVYNAGIDDGRMSEYEYIVDYILKNDRRIQKIYIELFPRHLLGSGVRMTPQSVGSLVSRYFLSFSAIRDALATLRENDYLEETGSRRISYFSQDGMWRVRDASAPMMNDVAAFNGLVNGAASAGFFSAELNYPQDISTLMSPVEGIVKRCSMVHVECIFYSVPTHPFELILIQAMNRLEMEKEIRIATANIAEVRDFSNYPSLAWPDICQMTDIWINTGHFSPKFGSLMVSSLAGQNQPEISSEFGAKIAELMLMTG